MESQHLDALLASIGISREDASARGVTKFMNQNEVMAALGIMGLDRKPHYAAVAAVVEAERRARMGASRRHVRATTAHDR